jgi:hypothetical protein
VSQFIGKASSMVKSIDGFSLSISSSFLQEPMNANSKIITGKNFIFFIFFIFKRAGHITACSQKVTG